MCSCLLVFVGFQPLQASISLFDHLSLLVFLFSSSLSFGTSCPCAIVLAECIFLNLHHRVALRFHAVNASVALFVSSAAFVALYLCRVEFVLIILLLAIH